MMTEWTDDEKEIMQMIADPLREIVLAVTQAVGPERAVELTRATLDALAREQA